MVETVYRKVVLHEVEMASSKRFEGAGHYSGDFKFDPNSTRNEGRWRLKDPSQFAGKFTRIKSKRTPGVSYLVGYNAGRKKWEVQAIRFDKRIIDERKAALWWNKNKNRFKKEWEWPGGQHPSLKG